MTEMSEMKIRVSSDLSKLSSVELKCQFTMLIVAEVSAS